MKEKHLSKGVFGVLALLMAVTLFVINPVSVVAADDAPGFYDKYSSSWYTGEKNSTWCAIKNIQKTDKVTSVKSSNPKVVAAKKITFNEGVPGIQITPKKVGSSKVTIKIKRNGKTYTSTRTDYVLKYTNPFKSVKVGNKEYVKSFDKTHSPNIAFRGSKKVSVKTKSDWKVRSIWTYNNKDGKIKSYKNNKTVNTKNTTQLSIELQNTKNKNIIISTHFLYN